MNGGVRLGDIRDQLQTLTGADLLASQLSDAGGKVFVSTNAKRSQEDLHQVVRFWQAIHVPTFGTPIPSSSILVSANDSTATMLQPSANQTAYVSNIQIENQGTDLVTVSISVGGVLAYSAAVPSSENIPVICGGEGKMFPFYLVGDQSMTITATGGSAGDIAYKVAYSLAVQG